MTQIPTIVKVRIQSAYIKASPEELRLLKRESDLFVEHLRYLIGQQKIAEAGTNEELRSLRAKAIVN